MFGVGWPEVVAAGALVAAVIIGWRWGTQSQWLTVDDRWRLAVTPAEVEPPLSRLLAALPAARLRAPLDSTWTLTVTRAPWWTLVLVVLLFPIGLLFLLIKEEADVEVRRAEVDGGTEIRLVGRTRASVRTTVQRALADLPVLAH
jgi:hypothetical protein